MVVAGADVVVVAGADVVVRVEVDVVVVVEAVVEVCPFEHAASIPPETRTAASAINSKPPPILLLSPCFIFFSS